MTEVKFTKQYYFISIFKIGNQTSNAINSQVSIELELIPCKQITINKIKFCCCWKVTGKYQKTKYNLSQLQKKTN